MALMEAIKKEDDMREIVLATIEELIVAKRHYENDEFSDAAENLNQALSNVCMVWWQLDLLEREVEGG